MLKVIVRTLLAATLLAATLIRGVSAVEDDRSARLEGYETNEIAVGTSSISGTSQDSTLLALYLIDSLARHNKMQRTVGGIAALGIGTLAIAASQRSDVVEGDMLGENVDRVFLAMGGMSVVTGIAALVKPSRAEKRADSVNKIVRTDIKEGLAYAGLIELAHYAKRIRRISSFSYSGLTAVALYTGIREEDSEYKLAAGALFGGMAVLSFMIKSVEERVLEMYEASGRGVIPPAVIPEFHLVSGSNARVVAGIRLVF